MKSMLIIEDIPEVGDWLQQQSGRVFPQAVQHRAASVAEACARLSYLSPDLALIDLGLPDGDGLSVLRTLKRDHPQTCCVVTTIFDDAGHLFPALRAGADGYLLKDDDEQEFTAALSGIVDGRPPLSPSIANMMLRHFQQTAQQMAQQEITLTSREEDMLVLVANGYSVKNAAESLGISVHTASGYLKNLYQKLQVTNRAEAALKAVNLGLINPADTL